MSMGDVKKSIMKVLEFRGKVWLDLEFRQSSVYSSLIPRMLTFTLAISCLTTSNLP